MGELVKGDAVAFTDEAVAEFTRNLGVGADAAEHHRTMMAEARGTINGFHPSDPTLALVQWGPKNERAHYVKFLRAV